MITPWAIGGLVFSAVTIIYAHLKGGDVEKRIALVYAFCVAASYLLNLSPYDHLLTFVLDLLFFIYIFIESLRTRKIWILCAAAFMLNSLLVQLISFSLDEKFTFGLATITGIWSGKGFTLALALGVLSVHKPFAKAEITSQN